MRPCASASGLLGSKRTAGVAAALDHAKHAHSSRRVALVLVEGLHREDGVAGPVDLARVAADAVRVREVARRDVEPHRLRGHRAACHVEDSQQSHRSDPQALPVIAVSRLPSRLFTSVRLTW